MSMFFSSPEYDFGAQRRLMSDGLNNALEYLSGELSLSQTLHNHLPIWRNYGMYHRGVRLLQSNDIESGTACLQKAAQYHERNPLSVRIFSPADLDGEEISLIRESLAEDDDRESRVDFLMDEELIKDERQKLADALKIIETSLPAFYSEAHTLVDQIVLTAGQEGGGYVRSGSAFGLYGQVLLMADPINTAMFHVEHVVHEVAHIALYPVNSYDELTLNKPTERFQAPLRSDLRPMAGMFHAAFVLVRIVQALGGLFGQISPSYEHELIERFDLSLDRFLETTKTIDTYGHLTEIGSSIMEESKAAVQETLSKIRLLA